MSPRDPDREGSFVRDDVRIAFSVYENDQPTILLMPTWSIVHSRHWKAQVPYLARHFRVLTFDGRGNGRSDRPHEPGAYSDQEFVADALATLDATGTERAVVAGVSFGGHWTALLAGLHPERVEGAILIGTPTSLVPPHPQRSTYPFEEELDTDQGWAKYNLHYWRRDYAGFANFFFSQIFSESHSTKQHEDAVAWALETDADTLIATRLTERIMGEAERAVLEAIRCPVLVIHGTDDQLTPVGAGSKLAEITHGSLFMIEGGGHMPQARDAVRVNLAIKEFADRVFAQAQARA
jgi:pimeloyl-ACP methyl ester carboxylesterase